MNIDDLTLGQIKQLQGVLGAPNTSQNAESAPVKIGEAYLFRTVTHIELGKVKSVSGKFVTLEQASWVADTGRYHIALKDGALNEVEPYPDTTTVNTDSLINFAPWAHQLPTEAK